MENDIHNQRDLSDRISEYFSRDSGRKPRFPSITRYEWEEDGKQYRSWKIDTGNMIVNTGDGGLELFLKAVRDHGK